MAQLSLTEVSKRFNINRTTIYRAVSSGKLSRLSNGLFDLSEVIRVFGEPPAPVKQSIEPPAINANDREVIALLKSQVELLTKQLEQKDAQIDFLQNRIAAPETPQNRTTASQSNDTETPIDQDLPQDNHKVEANSNDTKQHDETSLIGRFGRGFKAFLK